ncbi:uncharacterized protein [Primulina eburnea]|uniref:uncharacterized protein n=1 Tax=Primulina eburnea TaxID=1245227 RepID=UPI003C6CC070
MTMNFLSKSQEEKDLLERSTKKSKIATEHRVVGSDDVNMVIETPKATTIEMKQSTFKETLLGTQANDLPNRYKENDGFISDDDLYGEYEEDEGCPVIKISQEEKRRLRRPWQQTLIVKVMGRCYEFAKYGGPWLVLDHYLIVKEWYPNFDPLSDNTEKVLVWVRFPCLPIEYYDTDFLMKIGSKIGRPIRVDQATSLVSRGKFARICVEVDINKPLLAKFMLRRKVRKIEYEGIHLICFTCGVYGHRQGECKASKAAENFDGAAAQSTNERGEHSKDPIEPNRKVLIPAEVTETFGPWMMVSRPSRKFDKNRFGRPDNFGKQNNTRGPENIPIHHNGVHHSSFEILGEEANHDMGLNADGPEKHYDNPTLTGHLEGKGRRPNVQVNYKEVHTHNNDKSNSIIDEKQRHHLNNRGRQGYHYRARHAEEEHVLVRGSHGGTHITREVIHNKPSQDSWETDILLEEDLVDEHHQDPPLITRHPGDEDVMEHDADNGENDVVKETLCNINPLDFYMNLMVWNCQGAASKDLNRYLKDMIKYHNPKIVGLLEPRVSGTHADAICNKMKYENWVRVEAVGFSGGIWIFWNDDVTLEILYSHPQFVLARVETNNSVPWFLTIVYGSPNPTLRKRLWQDLTKENLNIQGSWLSVGDYNSVCNEHETSTTEGATHHRSAGFNDWLFNQGLIDIGFSGSRFTWAAWLTHEDFHKVVRNEWHDQHTLSDNVSKLANTLSSWNFSTFGNIHHRKRKLVARIEGVQRSLGNQARHSLFQLEAKLRRELDKVLEQEELLWFQKSREEWIVSGDRNTKFYHTSTMVKRSRSKIEALKDDNDIWITDTDLLKDKIRDFYTSLYTSDQTCAPSQVGRCCFPPLPEAHSLALHTPFSPDEVKRALFDMSPFKAPGPDGIPAGFYQKMWHIVGKSTCDYALNFFESGETPLGTNDTFLTLIPKVPNPEFVTQFRPISLCNVSYKILTKTMTNRLKTVMSDLIGPYQSSFVQGRQISDNIIVYQEVLHSMRKKSGAKGYMAIKIDLEKAFDRLSWEFIRETLTDVGLNKEWIRNIMNCITTSRLSILWNGEQMDWIKPNRGIRQGDSISPYIFVLCIERLSHIICEAVNNGSWKAIRLSRNGPHISHLLFADDMVLFAEASTDQLHIIMDCLNKFCLSSGQRVNFQKSHILFSRNVSATLANDLSSTSGIPLTTDLGRYLGVPSIHGRVTNNLFKKVLDRVKSRLEGWKTKYLSFAGRKVLVQSVLNAILLYSMQTNLLPMGVCSEIEKITRKFLWGGKIGKQKCHLVKWDVVSSPKSLGGLGIKRMYPLNQALLTKLGWRLMEEKESLWTLVLKGKYTRNSTDSRSFKSRQGSSKVWQGISKIMQYVEKGTKQVARNGTSTYFWTDKWIEKSPLYTFLLKSIDQADIQKKVHDYWIKGEGWDWGALSGLLPIDVENTLAAYILSEDQAIEDIRCWGNTITGKFSVSSAYELILNLYEQERDNSWGTIWKLEIPYLIRTFIWLVRHGKIMSNTERLKRGFTTNGSCALCQYELEDVDHIFRKCEEAKKIWCRLMPPKAFQTSLHPPFDAWLMRNLGHKSKTPKNLDWNILFAITLGGFGIGETTLSSTTRNWTWISKSSGSGVIYLKLNLPLLQRQFCQATVQVTPTLSSDGALHLKDGLHWT